MSKLIKVMIWCLAPLLCACSGTLYTSIDVMRPAKIAFPSNVNTILVVNNSPVQPPNVGHSTELFNQMAQKPSVKTDSLSIFCTTSFAEKIDKQEFFGKVDLITQSFKPYGSFTMAAQPLLREIADSLCTKRNADAIISLNKIIVTDLQAELFNENEASYTSYLEAKYDLQWSIYIAETKKIETLYTKDTLYWESTAFNRKKALEGLPNRHNSLIDGAIMAGESATKQFLPFWEKVDRYIFNSGEKVFKSGIDAVYQQKWKQAIKIWENLYNNSNNPYKKVKLANNLAVAYEISGNINKAFEYTEEAVKMLNTLSFIDYKTYWLIGSYYEELSVRKSEYKNIKNQLGL